MNFKKRKYMTKKSERNGISDSKIHQLNKLVEVGGREDLSVTWLSREAGCCNR